MLVKDFIKKYFTKTTAIIALVVLSTIGIYTAMNIRSQLMLTRAELEASRSLYSIIEKEKARLDSMRTTYIKIIAIRDTSIINRDRKIEIQSKEISRLRGELTAALEETKKVTADSSYKYINERIPPIAELKYPFDSLQVKKIYYTFLERDGLFIINGKLDVLVNSLGQSSILKDFQIKDLKSLNNVYISEKDILKRENEAYQIEITGLDKNIKKQKLFKTLSNGTAIGLAGYIIVNALIK